MSEFAGDIIGDALKEIVVSPSQQSISQFNAAAGIFYLNHMMMSLSVDGINLGYTAVNSFSDDVTVDDAALEPIVKLLAVNMSPLYKSSIISEELVRQSEDAIKNLRDISVSIGVSGYPGTLPVGSGNYGETYSNFYESPNDEVLTELGGDIAPEAIE